jgi:hypothetical protein
MNHQQGKKEVLYFATLEYYLSIRGSSHDLESKMNSVEFTLKVSKLVIVLVCT